MKRAVLVLLAAAAVIPALAMAEAGDIVVRARGVYVSPDETSKLGSVAPSVGGAAAKLEVEGNAIPEIDFSYYITKNIAAELILAVGTRHDVYLSKHDGSARSNLGSVNLLPPTLTLQWHFMPDQMFDPYVGGGLNYTLFMDRGLGTPVPNQGNIWVDKHSFGGVVQAGLDVNLKDGWMLNADVKRAWISTDVKLNGSKIDSLDIDPWLFGFGVGKRF